MQIKTVPEDFVVREIATLPLGKGKYDYYLLQKKGWTILGAVKRLADFLQIPLKYIGFAGNKDKQAVTTQYISVLSVPRKKVEQFSLPDVTLTYAGSGDQRLRLGDLEGNAFDIIVRDLPERKALSIMKIKNFFDDQRFGVEKNNVPVGKALIQGRFKDACDLLEIQYAGKDYLKALRLIPKKLLRLYVSSYQSYLWNIVADKLEDVETVPLVGFLTELDGKIGTLYKTLLKKEGVKPEDFLLKSMPELLNEGDERLLYAAVKDFSYTYEEDELHPMHFKCLLHFELQKGAYATMVVKQLFT
ncbi:MAG TPA: tRNA pseudouridine(13) synthase TruD [Candidatus Nanoarchaeia archaeon]|nr:tRNA pseudouridine(13) synthase TruD [Candidatus Nanoarchaeia archaeon]